MNIAHFWQGPDPELSRLDLESKRKVLEAFRCMGLALSLIGTVHCPIALLWLSV